MRAGARQWAGLAVLSLPCLLVSLDAEVLNLAARLAPVYILTTELVVVTVRAARAGMAAAVTETGCELGGALGIAVLGSLTVAAFRHGMAGYDLPPGATLTDVMSAAATLPPHLAEVMLQRADAAYGAAFTLMALTAAVLAGLAAVLAAVLRPGRPGAPARALPAAVREKAPEAGDAEGAGVPGPRAAEGGRSAPAGSTPNTPAA